MQPIHLYYRKPRAIFIAVFYCLFLGWLVLLLSLDAPDTSLTLPVVLNIFLLLLLMPSMQTALKVLNGKPMYTVNEEGITYFKSPGLIPWAQIVAMDVYSSEQTNDKTWKLLIKMEEGYTARYNVWVRFMINSNRRISNGDADFIIIPSYLTAPPRETIEAILSIYKEH